MFFVVCMCVISSFFVYWVIRILEIVGEEDNKDLVKVKFDVSFYFVVVVGGLLVMVIFFSLIMYCYLYRVRERI